MIDNEIVLCPICKNASKKIKNLDSTYIKNKLSKHFKKEIINDLEIIDYNLMKCNDCSFEFAYPQTEGSGSFYDWITSQPNYYTDSRWEYSKVLELLSKSKEKNSIKLLDVGCGDGQFFDQIARSKMLNIDFYGLDTTIGSVEICKNKGYKVFCLDVHKFKSEFKDNLFDVIVSFHCLEHISNPKEFLEELGSLINPLGTIYISTPYSPMPFELEWYDVLNFPPHHIGRWNLKSYNKIAEMLGLRIEVFMPVSEKLLNTAIQSFMFSIHGNINIISKKQILIDMIFRPLKFCCHLYKQSKREKVQGGRASYVILVKFTKK